jgi:hypothetical protein
MRGGMVKAVSVGAGEKALKGGKAQESYVLIMV